MSENVEDYMSEDFLTNCPDVRPGAILTSKARKCKIESEQCEARATNKRQKTSLIENEVRNDALNKPLATDNKGFVMLTKMGFKVGSKLGRPQGKLDLKDPEQGGSGLKDPLAIDLKLDKKGLGHKTVEKERKAAADRVRQFQNKARTILTKDFDNRLKEKARYRSAYKDYLKAQKVCYDLDARKDLEYPTERWFWPVYALPQEEEEELDSEETEKSDQMANYQDLISTIGRRLCSICDHIRSTHFYCVWCGVNYNDAEDMENNCPGYGKDDHEVDYDDL